MTKWVAPKGTAHLIYKNKELLSKRFPTYLIEEAYRMSAADSFDPVTDGKGAGQEPGLYDLLWALGEEYDCGLVVFADRLPILQMSVEICDYLGEDLFELTMSGSQIMICDNPYLLKENLEFKGVELTVIGYLTDNRDRVIADGDRLTYITPPDRRK